MNLFQVIGLIVCASFAVSTLLTVSRGRIGPGAGLGWLLLWLAAGLAIAWPETTVLVARLLGISRGADLVFYVAILGMIVGFFSVYLRLRRIESNVTSLVRRIAVDEALADGPLEERPPPGPDDEGS